MITRAAITLKILKNRFVACGAAAMFLLGIGDWMEQKALKSIQSDGWILMKVGIVLFHKELLIGGIVVFMVLDLLSRGNRERLIKEWKEVLDDQRSIAMRALIVSVTVLSVVVLWNGFQHARTDFNRLRTGKDFFGQLLGQRLLNQGEENFSEGNLPEALRFFRAADALLQQNQLKSTIESLEKVPSMREQLVRELSSCAYSPAAVAVEEEFWNDDDEVFRKAIRKIASDRSKAYLSLNEELAGFLRTAQWAKARSVLAQFEGRGYSLGVQNLLDDELQYRISYPDKKVGTTGATWVDVVSVHAGQCDAAICRRKDYFYFSSNSPDMLEMFSKAEEGIYSAEGLATTSTLISWYDIEGERWHDSWKLVGASGLDRFLALRREAKAETPSWSETEMETILSQADVEMEFQNKKKRRFAADRSEDADEESAGESRTIVAEESWNGEVKPLVSSSAFPVAKIPSIQSKRIHSVTLNEEMTLGEFAKKHGTDTKILNELNGLDLAPSVLLAVGSELYVPVQPSESE